MPSSLRTKTQLHFIAALILALLAAFLVSTWLKQQQDRIRKELASVIVAKLPIQPHTKITPDMLQVMSYPKELLPVGAVIQADQVIGKLTRSALFPGQILMPTLIGSREEITSLSFLLEPGRRALTIRIDEQSGVGFQIQEGDRVDIIGSISGGDNNPAVTRIILENIRVLKLSGTASTAGQQQPRGASTATLDLSPEEAELVTLLDAQANIRLVLRPFSDEADVRSTGATVDKARSYQSGRGYLAELQRPLPTTSKESTGTPPPSERSLKIDYIRGAQIVPVQVQP
ncbi:MAG: Flp pilus assembly protein CpaB [Verrucomicrobiota bacterium]|nr:Flp pilus assembly protein CpaB [Verrucomicrobiota bacterium]